MTTFVGLNLLQKAMDFLELVKTRRAVRKYLPKEVENEKIDYIMECARLAPSACNNQPWFFYIVRSDEAKDIVNKSYPRNWMIDNPAPVYIIACGDKNQSWKRSHDQKDHADIDIAIAFEHICLAAAEKGLGTCWICHFDTEITREMLKLPENMIPIAITPVGYFEESEVGKSSRKPMEDICSTI